jgi:predicted TIM-barrel fold metal-dependent hydrolase
MTDSVFPPEGTCDCHVHVIGPKARFPLVSGRSYTPLDAPLEDLRAKLDELAIDRVVIVQPSIYGTDNSCLVDAIENLGECARGIAVVAPRCTPSELDLLHDRGIRGLRVNGVSVDSGGLANIRAQLSSAALHCQRNGWHIQAFLAPTVIEALAQELIALPAPVVIDHFGLLRPDTATTAQIDALRSLLASGKGWAKLSAPYRIAEDIEAPGVTGLARLLAENPDAVIWGSDWPHTPSHSSKGANTGTELPYRDLDTGRLLNIVTDWFPDAAMQKRILVTNPMRLYGWHT